MRMILIVNLVLLILVGGYFFFKYKQYQDFKQTPVEVQEPVTVVIEKGTSWKQVAARLAEAKLITSERYFYYMIKEKELGKKLQTGEFEFQGKLLPEEIAQSIIDGKVKLYTVTIPEGFNKYDLAALLARLDWVRDGGEFLKYCDAPRILRELGIPEAMSCDGLLFPSTYKLPRNVSVEEIIHVMDKRMQEVLAKYRTEIKKSGFSPMQVITLASVIEKESGVRDEQPHIAAAFLNRLKQGIKLQSDPTVIYGLLPAFDGNITRKHLETDHPHNTYTRQGLPATPICFPGENAIRSVVEPMQSEDIFFVATGEGRHHFSKTYEEHAAAVEHYQVKGQRTPFVWKKK